METERLSGSSNAVVPGAKPRSGAIGGGAVAGTSSVGPSVGGDVHYFEALEPELGPVERRLEAKLVIVGDGGQIFTSP